MKKKDTSKQKRNPSYVNLWDTAKDIPRAKIIIIVIIYSYNAFIILSKKDKRWRNLLLSRKLDKNKNLFCNLGRENL